MSPAMLSLPRRIGLRNVLLLLFAVLLTACSAVPQPTPGEQLPRHPVEIEIKQGVHYPIDDVYDPFERVNRRIYDFNYYFDKYVFLPVVNTYRFLLPDYAEQRVSSFFGNLGEIGNFLNNLLQFKPRATGMTLSRFLINSTAGIAGLWDPATAMGIPRQPEDFGQTLGHYGAGHGPYLVLPILGPSNVRDTGGFVVDTTAYTLFGPPSWSEEEQVGTGLTGLDAIDRRHRQPFRYHASGSPFEYEIVRFLYSKKRELEIAK
jgi:phospholipid-binding lipoprotein MlaA